jgi:hypothetical protein
MTESRDPEDRRERPEPSPEAKTRETKDAGESPDAPEPAEPAEPVEPEPSEVPQDEPSRPLIRLAPGVRAGIPALALLVLLAVASFVPRIEVTAGGSDEASARDLEAVITGLPAGAPVLVDIDGDLGTYPEIRAATRAALADLMSQGANLAIVSFSAEGRAIAAAEIARLRNLGAGPDRLLDLGFRSGGEPALVQLAGSGIGPDANGPFADALRKGGTRSFRLALVIGGAEIGPRSWVEQVQPRLPDLPIGGITPSFLLPEVLPYRSSGQLIALLGTLPADVAYAKTVGAKGTAFGPGSFTDRSPSGGAMVFGILVAIAVLLASSGGSLAGWARAVWRRAQS